MNKLSSKQKAFCEEYLIDLNAVQAAIRAGYSKKTARQIGSENLSKPDVAKYIAELKAERSLLTKIDAAYVLKRHIEIDKMDFADILCDDHSFKPIKEWPIVWRQYLSGIDLSEIWDGSGEDKKITGMLKKIKWPDKVRNLEMLGKHVDVQAYLEKKESKNIEMSHEEWLDSLK